MHTQNRPVGPTRRSRAMCSDGFSPPFVFLRASQQKRRFVFDDRLPYEFDGPGWAGQRPCVRRRCLTGTSLAGCRQLTMSLSKIRGVDSRADAIQSLTDKATKRRLPVSVCLTA